MRSLRVLSRLLAYPNAELQAQMTALQEVLIEEGVLKGKIAKNLLGFMDAMAARDLMDAQEEYVELFDRGRAHCLHLFEHVHGESRFRGAAMVDLAARYAEKGLEIGVGELPDYLPLFLEFVSICPPQEGLELLEQSAPVIATIGEKLRRRKSDYAFVFEAIVAISGVKLSKDDIAKAASAALPEIETLDALDKEWEEPPAFGGAADCSTCVSDPMAPGAPRAPVGPSILTNGGTRS